MIENRKSRMTKRLFHETMIELMGKKPVGKITVKEICESADLNRSTFYAHYTEPLDILREMEDEFMQRHQEAVTTERRTMEQTLEAYLDALKKEEPYLTLLLEQDPAFRRRIMQSTHALYTEQTMLGQYGNGLDEMQKLDFISCGSMYLIENWLKNPSGYSSTDLAGLIIRIMKAAVSA